MNSPLLSLLEDSPIYTLLPLQSRLQSIDDCQVKTSQDWYQCLRVIHDRHPLTSSGYCLTSADIQLLSTRIGQRQRGASEKRTVLLEFNQSSAYDCCQNLSPKNYCFLYRSPSAPLTGQNGACMEARRVSNYPSCLLESDCQASCLRPFSMDNRTRLMRIGHSDGPPILFVGAIGELYRSSEWTGLVELQ